MSEPGQVPAGWYPDPHHRFTHRYWNGTAWTDDVATNGITATDPVVAPTSTRTIEAVVGSAQNDLTAGRPTAADGTSDWPPTRILGVIGAGLLCVGSVLPWAEVRVLFLSKTFSGTEGDGKITLVVGLASVVLFLVAGRSTAGVLAAVVAAGIGGAVAAYDLVNVSRAVSGVSSTAAADASVGVGLYVCTAGAAAAVIGGLLYVLRSSAGST